MGYAPQYPNLTTKFVGLILVGVYLVAIVRIADLQFLFVTIRWL